MINSIITGIFKLFFSIIKFLANIITLPLTLLINGLLPNFTNYLSQANTFINDYFLKAIAVGREIFLNATGFPQELITISVTLAFAIISAKITIRIFRFIKNIYIMFKGGKTSG